MEMFMKKLTALLSFIIIFVFTTCDLKKTGDQSDFLTGNYYSSYERGLKQIQDIFQYFQEFVFYYLLLRYLFQ